jgi:NlpC/P60 family putative phage cell wall peptidase
VNARIVAEALSWCGTPFHAGAAVKGAGCDCYGLVVGVWAALTGRQPQPLPCAYQPERTALRRVQDQMFVHLSGIAERGALWSTAPGDILLFAPDGGTVVHCGILTAEHHFVHARNVGAGGEVALARFTPRWREWHLLTYRFML